MNKLFNRTALKIRKYNDVLYGFKRVDKGDPIFIRTKILFFTISLVIATLLWSFVGDGKANITRNFEVPIKYTNISKNYDLIKDTETVSVKLNGNISLLTRMHSSAVTAKVNLAGFPEGSYNLPVYIDVPGSVKIVSSKPNSVQVEIFKKFTKKIPVTIKLVGDETKIFEYAELIKPCFVYLKGPKDRVLSVDSVQSIIPVEKIENSKAVTAEPVIYDAGGNEIDNLKIVPAKVTIKIDENAVLRKKQVTMLPIAYNIKGLPQHGYEIESVRFIPEKISVRGNSSIAEQIKEIHLKNEIDISGINQNITKQITVNDLLPVNGLEIMSPEKIKIEINVKEIQNVHSGQVR